MRQISQVHHCLEVRERPNLIFHPLWPSHELYGPAAKLAHHGQLEAAMERAAELHIKKHGQMHGVTFRCVSRTITVSVQGHWESAGELPDR